MRSQPLVVGRAGDAEHRRARTFGQLHGYRAYPAGGAGDRDSVTGRQLDRPDCGVCRCAGDEEAPAASHDTAGGLVVS